MIKPFLFEIALGMKDPKVYPAIIVLYYVCSNKRILYLLSKYWWKFTLFIGSYLNSNLVFIIILPSKFSEIAFANLIFKSNSF
jgi:hypothetical protein